MQLRSYEKMHLVKKMFYKDRLSYLREEQELTQNEISRLFGFHKNVYGQFEREETIIPIKHLNTLCNYFDVSLDYIFKFTNNKKYLSSAKDINLKLSSSRLKSFRKEFGLTQKKLSDILKTDNSTISKYERALFPIATPYLYQICKKYGISADYLLGKINVPKYYNAS